MGKTRATRQPVLRELHATAAPIITWFIAKGNVKDAAKILNIWSPRDNAGDYVGSLPSMTKARTWRAST